MISKAFIEKKIDDYTYKVRIPRFNKSSSSTYSSKDIDLYTATICYLPGIIPYYDINDVVFVAYENNESSNPVIIGKLYRAIDESNSISAVNTNLIEQIENNDTNFNSVFDSVLDNTIDTTTTISQIKEDITNLKISVTSINKSIESLDKSITNINNTIKALDNSYLKYTNLS